ncbi:hypothetical protein BDV97DRAFT_1640 [Delphinella strobiligena]|nr:hypothetical protein BDV97DRAFT_1640 [Delphinella strobiligena]
MPRLRAGEGSTDLHLHLPLISQISQNPRRLEYDNGYINTPRSAMTKKWSDGVGCGPSLPKVCGHELLDHTTSLVDKYTAIIALCRPRTAWSAAGSLRGPEVQDTGLRTLNDDFLLGLWSRISLSQCLTLVQLPFLAHLPSLHKTQHGMWLLSPAGF